MDIRLKNWLKNKLHQVDDNMLLNVKQYSNSKSWIIDSKSMITPMLLHLAMSLHRPQLRAPRRLYTVSSLGLLLFSQWRKLNCWGFLSDHWDKLIIQKTVMKPWSRNWCNYHINFEDCHHCAFCILKTETSWEKKIPTANYSLIKNCNNFFPSVVAPSWLWDMRH